MSLLHLVNVNSLADPNRVSAQIVSGIGFLGAGAIIQGRGNVIVLTTAATIWVVAAIGFTVGLGYPISATLFSLTVLWVLKLINPLYHLLEREKDQRLMCLEVLSVGSVKKTVKDVIFSETLEIDELYEESYDKKRNKIILTAIVTAHPRMMERIVGEIVNSVKVEKVNYHIHLEEVSEISMLKDDDDDEDEAEKISRA